MPDPITSAAVSMPLDRAALLAGAAATHGRAAAALELAARFGRELPRPGSGRTAERWHALTAVARLDLTAARVLEAHTDALAILAEAGEHPASGTWGVFASEAPETVLAGDAVTGTLTGTKPWCSLAGSLDHALVTGTTSAGRQLFAVDLRLPGVGVESADGWVAHGLREVTSGAVHFDAVRARPVGTEGWYLERDGFAWGGLGVAACWLGGAEGLNDTLLTRLAGRDGALAELHIGTVDLALFTARLALHDAAVQVDGGRARGPAGALLALRVRSVVADAVETVLRQVGHALGPAPLAFDAEHARRIADLQLYVRQHHAERDVSTLGAFVRSAQVTSPAPAFDHRVPGTAAGAWDGPLAAVEPTCLPPVGRALVVVAHPDDETLGAGGVISRLAAQATEIELIVATDGEASHPRSPTHAPAELAAVRRDELRAALSYLAPDAGSDSVSFLGLPDGRVRDHRQIVTAAVGHALERGADLVLSTWMGDEHPDHAACARAVAEAIDARARVRSAEQDKHLVQHWQFPIWLWHWGTPADLPAGLRQVALSPAEISLKSIALQEHRSQHSALSDAGGDEAILPPAIQDHFRRSSEFFVVDGDADDTLDAPASATAYFDALYQASPDPWRLADSFYETRKRALLLAALPRQRFARAFEPGCAIGLTTEALSDRCDAVVAWDAAAAAVEATRNRLAHLPPDRLGVECRRIADEWPDDVFELVVLSEVGYYCTDLDLLVRRLVDGAADDAVIAACHWRRRADDHRHTGDAVHAALAAGLVGWTRVAGHLEDDFRLDVWARSPLSVAQREGIVT